MKTLITFIILLTGLSAMAGIKVPRSVFKVEQLNEAKEEAQKDAEPIAFVYSDPSAK